MIKHYLPREQTNTHIMGIPRIWMGVFGTIGSILALILAITGNLEDELSIIVPWIPLVLAAPALVYGLYKAHKNPRWGMRTQQRVDGALRPWRGILVASLWVAVVGGCGAFIVIKLFF